MAAANCIPESATPLSAPASLHREDVKFQIWQKKPGWQHANYGVLQGAVG